MSYVILAFTHMQTGNHPGKKNQFEENFGGKDILERKKIILVKKHQPSGARGTRSPSATPQCLQCCRGQLTLPESENGDHLSIVISALWSTFAQLVFRSEQLSVCLPPLGEANESWNPQMEKRSTFLFSNINFHYLKVFHPSTPDKKINGKK